MMTRRGFAVRIADHVMLTPNEAAIGSEEGPEFLFQLLMGEGENARAYYFDRVGLDKFCRTIRKVETHVKEEIDGIKPPTATEQLIKNLGHKKQQMVAELTSIETRWGCSIEDIEVEIKRLIKYGGEEEDDVFDDSS